VVVLQMVLLLLVLLLLIIKVGSTCPFPTLGALNTIGCALAAAATATNFHTLNAHIDSPLPA